MTFSATEAAFEGFRVVRRHPLAILFWGLAYLIFFAAAFALIGGPLATVMATAKALEGGQPSQQELMALGQSYMNIMLVLFPLGLIFGAILNTAVARAVLRPSEKAFGYLRLGGDELRVLAVTLILGLVFGALFIILFTAAGVLAGLGGQANAGVGILIGVLAGVGVTALLAWLGVRLSLAVPATLIEKRIAPFSTFGLTKGRAFPLLGMAIIAVIMSFLVSFLSYIISLPIDMATGGLEQLVNMDGQTTLQILQAAGPGLIAWAVINALSSALQLAVIYAPFSAAYRDLKGLPHE